MQKQQDKSIEAYLSFHLASNLSWRTQTPPLSRTPPPLPTPSFPSPSSFPSLAMGRDMNPKSSPSLASMQGREEGPLPPITGQVSLRRAVVVWTDPRGNQHQTQVRPFRDSTKSSTKPTHAPRSVHALATRHCSIPSSCRNNTTIPKYTISYHTSNPTFQHQGNSSLPNIMQLQTHAGVSF